MKIFLIGHKGWIGQKFCRILENQNITYVTSDFRAENDEIFEEILKHNATHVLCCLGRTHGELDGVVYNTIDYLEDIRATKTNINDNLYAPVSLSLFCDKKGIHFTYIGTGCIFSYDDDHGIDSKNGFVEHDKPNFFGSQYSIVKGFTDQLMRQTNALSLRIRMPIAGDLNDRNFISKIIKYDKICSIQNSMTVLDEMLPLCIKMMQNDERGTFNFTNPGTISHNEILELYKDIIDPNFHWQNFDIVEQDKILKSKRSNNRLNTTKLEEKYNVCPIKQSVKQVLERLKSTM
jgi:dTDP-4-dehydrorhamnose reductase